MSARQRLLGQTVKPLIAWGVVGVCSVVLIGSIMAQTLPAPLAQPAAKGASAVPKPATQQTKTAVITPGPSWADLTTAQKAALAPLATSWPSTAEPQKRKWLEIAKNFSRLTPAEQATMTGRMTEWVALSPQQRAQARLNFAKTKELSTQLTPDERKAKWETYQALSPEQKKDLAAKAVQKPAGAATAVKPVAPQKLAVGPKANAPASAPASAVASSASPGSQAPLPAAATLAPAAPLSTPLSTPPNTPSATPLAAPAPSKP